MDADDKDSELTNKRRDEIEMRRLWATASLIALGFYAGLGALLVFLRSRWGDLTSSARTTCVFGILAANYAVALLGTIRKNKPVGKLFFFVGAFLYALALTILFYNSSACFQAPETLNFLDASTSIIGYWALGTFVLAFAYESRALHVVAMLATLLWLVVEPRQIGAPVALVYCALGEHWAWRRNSSGVSYAYLATSLCVLALAFVTPGLRVGAALIAPLAVLGFVVLYWFGVNFRSAPLRGLGILGVACALGVGSFNEYWISTLKLVDDMSESAGSLTIRLLSSAFGLVFVLYCASVMITGARLSVARFVFGAVALVAWVVVLSSRAGAVSLGLTFVAIAVFVFLAVEFSLRASNKARNKKSKPLKSRTTETDALNDDSEFDDVFDAEARSVRDAPHVLAIAEFLEERRRKFFSLLGNAPVWGAVALQFLLLWLVARRF